MPPQTPQEPIAAPAGPGAPQGQPKDVVPEELSKQADLKETHATTAFEFGELSFEDAIKLFNDAKTYVDSGYRTRWDNYFKVYSGRRIKRNYDGIADPVIRESHTIIETLVANIASGSPRFKFVKTNKEQTGDVNVLNGLLDYTMQYNNMGLKNQEWVRDMLLYGTGILHVEWRDKMPNVENIPLRDFFVDPTATCLEDARYAGYQYLVDAKTLKNELIYDADEDKMVPRYKNLEEIGFDKDQKAAANDGDHAAMDKNFKDMFRSSTLGEKAFDQQVHVIRMYHLPTGRMVEIGNKKKFIYDEKTVCYREETEVPIETEFEGKFVPGKKKLDAIDPFLPFAVLRDYVDSSQFFGEGEMALLVDDAELLNDYEAMDIDNNAYQNSPMYWVDPQFADLIPDIETISGAVYPIPRNAMGAIERPQLTGDLDMKKERIMQRMRRATAADEAVQGVSQTGDRTTATEVQSQLMQAQTRFSTKISNLESEGYAQLGDVIRKFFQIFITESTTVRIVGKQGVEFKDYDPWEFDGVLEPHVELETTINSKKQEVGMKMNQVFQLFTGDVAFNQVEVKRWMAQFIDPDLTDDKFNEMIAPAMPPKETSFDTVTINYKDLEPWAKRQAQIKAGWEPDPSLSGDEQNRMAKQAVEGADLMNPTTDASNALIPGMEGVINPQEETAEGPKGDNKKEEALETPHTAETFKKK